jgi:hypothetical protein
LNNYPRYSINALQNGNIPVGVVASITFTILISGKAVASKIIILLWSHAETTTYFPS